MKKLIAILMACTMMTAFVSCDSSDKDKESSESKTSVSESVDDSSKDSSKDSDDEGSSKDDESSEKEESSDKDEDSDSKDSKSEDADESSKAALPEVEAGKIDEKLVGSWTAEEMGGGSMVFSKDNRLSMVVDYSEMMNFKNGKLVTSGEECDTTFDGKKITAKSQDQDVLVLEREGDADSSNMDGKYILTGGAIYDMMGATGMKIYFTITGEKLVMEMDMCEYAADGKYITVLGDEIGMFSSEDGDDVTSEYKIDGETLTIFSDDEEEVFIRTKE